MVKDITKLGKLLAFMKRLMEVKFSGRLILSFHKGDLSEKVVTRKEEKV